ncbi:MAG: nucleoside hydrolase [Sedimentisphaerales bacterium]|nr:nucleoside hydrolase [Sedimentisphaerales bacterium]
MNLKHSLIPVFVLITVLIFAPVAPLRAHEITNEQPLIIVDTDLGLDDTAAMALILQSSDVKVAAVVAVDGACEGTMCTDFLARILWQFNRTDVMLYEPTQPLKPIPAPPFRDFVQNALTTALSQEVERHTYHSFKPEAYTVTGRQTTILALGPLTNLAVALQAGPEIKTGISKIIIPGRPETERSWNLRYDPQAYEVVRQSGIPLTFIAPQGETARKPAAWQTELTDFGPNTAIGEQFLRKLLAPDPVREHYVTQLSFYDELAFIYVIQPTLFEPTEDESILIPTKNANIAECFAEHIAEGRQHKPHVVFADDPLPASVLRPDVRERMDRIISKNSETEWFAQLIMNELHEHLGAYSVIGVKMGLYAMELLNAPQHEMQVVSHVPPQPPVSCLNDGIIVATGCTPGRALFSQGPIDPNEVKVSFTYNHRTITLALKDKYRHEIQKNIKNLLSISSLEDQAYWTGVRILGLNIWENWHRRNLFNVIQTEKDD